MSTTSAQLSTELHTRQQILDAAEARFRVYGYNKTTMAEIAQDTSMSAANLYRFFKNKIEIAGACAERCIFEKIDLVRAAVQQRQLSAEERLNLFINSTLEVCHDNCANDIKLNELVALITSERPDLIHKKIDRECALLAEILAYGNESGEFVVEDIIATARTIHTATTAFGTPIFMGLYPLDEFQQRANEVCALIINGIKKR